MALYDARCNICYKVYEYEKPMKDCMDTPTCCGVKTEKVILSTPLMRGEVPWFHSKLKHLY